MSDLFGAPAAAGAAAPDLARRIRALVADAARWRRLDACERDFLHRLNALLDPDREMSDRQRLWFLDIERRAAG